jgi:hypothetical protein
MPNYQLPIPAIEIPGGEFYMGSDAAEALDNERSRHLCYLEAYSIDRYPSLAVNTEISWNPAAIKT